MCISKYAEDDSWYRATIQTVSKEHMATVFMVDFGNTEKVSFNDLRPASPELMNFPVFVSEFTENGFYSIVLMMHTTKMLSERKHVLKCNGLVQSTIPVI